MVQPITPNPVKKSFPYSLPRLFLHLEGAITLITATVIFFQLGYPWWVFLLFLLAPDLSAIGYLGGAKVGSITYNMAHTSAFPLILALVSWVTGWSLGLPIAMIWLAHIGMDRMVGYGLKYPESFKQNHLGRV
jgi:hypothetical protein